MLLLKLLNQLVIFLILICCVCSWDHMTNVPTACCSVKQDDSQRWTFNIPGLDSRLHTRVFWRQMSSFLWSMKNFVSATRILPDFMRNPLYQQIREVIAAKKSFKEQFPNDIPSRYNLDKCTEILKIDPQFYDEDEEKPEDTTTTPTTEPEKSTKPGGRRLSVEDEGAAQQSTKGRLLNKSKVRNSRFFPIYKGFAPSPFDYTLLSHSPQRTFA